MGAKPKQAGKKEGGWGEGIFARLLPFPFRLRKGKAEGGFVTGRSKPIISGHIKSDDYLIVQAVSKGGRNEQDIRYEARAG